jgi:hypothetical protein
MSHVSYNVRKRVLRYLGAGLSASNIPWHQACHVLIYFLRSTGIQQSVPPPTNLSQYGKHLPTNRTPFMLAEVSVSDSRLRYGPSFQPMRTSIRTYHNVSLEWQRAQEQRRRSKLCALAMSCGLLPPVQPSSHLEPTTWHTPHLHESEMCSRAWREELRNRLIGTPTAARRDLRRTISQHSRERPPSRSNIISGYRGGLQTAGAERQRLASGQVTIVDVCPISVCTVEDPTLYAAAPHCVLPLHAHLLRFTGPTGMHLNLESFAYVGLWS